MKIRFVSLFYGLLLFLASAANASDIDISGYASFAGTYSNAKTTTGSNADFYNGLATKDAQFDTEGSHFGLQIHTKVSEKVHFAADLSAQGGSSNYNVKASWAYATYDFNDELSLRMGKYKGAFYMVSDYKDVGYAYPWVRPPLEVYSTNPIRSLSGLDLVYQGTVSDLSVLLELYAGNGTHTAKYLPSTIDDTSLGLPSTVKKGDSVEFKTPNAKGFNLSVSGDIGTFRIGYFQTQVDAAAFGKYHEFGSFGGLGFNIDWHNLVVYSEYIMRDTAANLAGAFPDQTAYYVTTGYRMGKFLPYITYAKLDKGKDNSPYAQLQSSVALGLRTEVSSSSAVKFEVMKVTPVKNSLSTSFNSTTSGYGLFNLPVKDGTIATVTFDVIF